MYLPIVSDPFLFAENPANCFDHPVAYGPTTPPVDAYVILPKHNTDADANDRDDPSSSQRPSTPSPAASTDPTASNTSEPQPATTRSPVSARSRTAVPETATTFYGVAVGRVPGVYTNWDDVKAVCDGFKGQKQKKFSTRAQAVAYVLKHLSAPATVTTSTDDAPASASSSSSSAASTTTVTKPRSSQRRKRRGHGWSLKGNKASRSKAKPRVSVPTPPPVTDADYSAGAAGLANLIKSVNSISSVGSAPPTSPSNSEFTYSEQTEIDEYDGFLQSRIDSAGPDATVIKAMSPPRPLPLRRGNTTVRSRYRWNGGRTTMHYPTVCNPSAAHDAHRGIAERAVDSDPRILSSRPPSPILDVTSYHADRAATIKAILVDTVAAYTTATGHLPNTIVTEATTLVATTSTATKTIVDSGSTRHLERDESKVTSVTPCAPVIINGISGKPIRVQKEGRVGACSHVLLVPPASASVRSVGCITDQYDAPVVFTRRGSFLVPDLEVPPNAVRIGTRKEDGLYHFIYKSLPPPPTPVTACLSVAQQVKREQIHRLHRVFGHASPQRMRLILTRHPEVATTLRPADVQLFTTCDACSIGSSTVQPTGSATYTRASAFGYRLHADTTGTVRPSTSSGFTRVLFVVDDASRWVFIALLLKACMDTIAAALRSILREAANGESVLRTKILRTDNGKEFKNSLVDALLAEADIIRELTCVATSHQNGVAERAIGVIFAMARTLLIDAALPPRFWGEAVMVAVHIRNRMPCSANKGDISPFQARYGYPPDLRHLRPFGCTAYVHITAHKTKVMPRALRGIFIGYGHDVSGQKGWRVFLPHNNSVVTSTNVTFDLDLRASIARRNPDLVSADAPYIHEATVPTAPPQRSSSGPLPSSLQIRPRDDNVVPIITQPTAESAAQFRNTTFRTPKAEPRVATPAVTRSRAAVPTAAPLSHGEAPSARNVPLPRPRGRPPANSTWNPTMGKYVPNDHLESAMLLDLMTDHAPSFAAAWVHVVESTPDLASSHPTPVKFSSAVTGPEKHKWKPSIKSELDSLNEVRDGIPTWKFVPISSLPIGAKPIRTKWVFKIKADSAGRITRYKSRLTACGYAQRKGRDFHETFAPVASANTIRLVFALAAIHGMLIQQHDITTAFLYGILPEDERVYLEIPEGVDAPPGTVLQCLRGIYGLKQAPRLFNLHLRKVLQRLGYVQSQSDPCLFYLRRGSDLSVLAIVVDDILQVTTSRSLVEEFNRGMDATYKTKHLGTPQFMIGIKVSLSTSGIHLSQESYIRDIARRFGQLKSSPAPTPANATGCLSVTTGNNDSAPLNTKTHPYMSLIGCILWATITRPDIATAVSRACQRSKAPTMADWRAAMRILRYLLATASHGLMYPLAPRPLRVTTHVDAAFANEQKQRSRYGFVLFLSGCPIMWSTKSTTMVCLSTAEAEFVAATEACKDVSWVRNLLSELGLALTSPSTVHEDNQACIRMVANHVVSGRNRHFCTKMAWLRQLVASGEVKFAYIPSNDNVADHFTKIIPHHRFLAIRPRLVSPRPDVPSSSTV